MFASPEEFYILFRIPFSGIMGITGVLDGMRAFLFKMYSFLYFHYPCLLTVPLLRCVSFPLVPSSPLLK